MIGTKRYHKRIRAEHEKMDEEKLSDRDKDLMVRDSTLHFQDIYPVLTKAYSSS